MSRAVVLLLALTLALAAAAGCGGSGNDPRAESEKAADGEVLDELLAGERAVVRAYAPSLTLVRGRGRPVALELRGQDQEHVDALTKAIRGVGGEIEAEETQPEGAPPHERDEALRLAYEAENAALGEALASVNHLQTSAPRGLAAALATSHAQHLVVLRQLLGAGLAASVPNPFEPGDEPPPEPR